MSCASSILFPESQHSLSLSSIQKSERSNLKILSLDGGGIRGLSMLIILEEIFFRLNSRREAAVPPLPPIEPYEYFDLIGGTSTGGIIALMLGRLRMTIKQCKNEYLKLGEQIFGDKSKFWHENKFSSSKLEAVLKRVISRQLTSHEGVPGREDAPLIDPRRDDCCRTIVFTVSYVNANPAEAVGLRTYPSDQGNGKNFTIWQAARATSAAPTFFKPLIVPADGNSQWVDGGLNVNNPAWLILNDAKRIWSDEEELLDLNRIGLFLSLGTGVTQSATLEGGFFSELKNRLGVPEKLIRAIVQTTFDTEKPNQLLLSVFPRKSMVYHRFNVDRSLRDIELFEYKRTKQIVEYTEAYLRRQETVEKLNDCTSQAIEVMLDPSLSRVSRSIFERPLPELIDILKTNASLLKNTEHYFDHLTVEGLEMYDAIYEAICVATFKEQEGYVSFPDLVFALSSAGTTSPKLGDIWNRLSGGLSARMPRNLMLCILYMIHVECLDPRFIDQRPASSEDGTPKLTRDRLRIAKSFGNWVECRFHDGAAWCGREWNYANNPWGMCRGLDTDVECPLWQFHLGRIENWQDRDVKDAYYTVTMSPQDHADAKGFRDQCRKKWLKKSENFIQL